jgi:nucleoside phosphorylase
LDAALTLACALRVEEKAARVSGARTALVGLGAGRPLPDGRLVSFGFAGGLAADLEPGELVTAERVVDVEGRTLWEGEPIDVPGARRVVTCAVEEVANDPEARLALAERTGAHVVDMESGRLAATGRLAGVVRAISDTGTEPVGALACAGKADGGTDWGVVAKAFLTQPVRSARTARAGRRALSSLGRAARHLR